MTKISYSSFYAFVSSVGAGLIFLAVAGPFWLISKANSLLKETAEMAKTHPEAQDTTTLLTSTIMWFVQYLHYVSPALFVLGVLVLIYGVILWRRAQSVQDKTAQVNHDLKAGELKRMTEEEEKSKLKAEFDAIQEAASITHEDVILNREAFERQYTSIKGILYNKFKECYHGEYRITGNLSYVTGLAETVTYDFIFQRRVDQLQNIVLILRYDPTGILHKDLEKVAKEAFNAFTLHRMDSDKEETTVLLFVGTKSALAESWPDQRSRALATVKALGAKDMLIECIFEEDLPEMNCSQLRALVPPQ